MNEFEKALDTLLEFNKIKERTLPMIYHKIIKINGKLKPVCMPKDPKVWRTVKAGMVNCKNCLSGTKAE